MRWVCHSQGANDRTDATHNGDIVLSRTGNEPSLCAIWHVEGDLQQMPNPLIERVHRAWRRCGSNARQNDGARGSRIDLHFRRGDAHLEPALLAGGLAAPVRR